jgi:hypothetical protein
MDEAKQNANAESNNRTAANKPRGNHRKDSIMNTLNKIFSAAATAAVLLSANVAFADTGLTRAQVTAELAQARASGALAALNSDDPAFFLQAPVSAKSRTQVTADLQQARATGQIAALNSDDSANFLRTSNVAGSTQIAGASKTRAQVMAELRASQADGTLALLHSEDPSDQVRVAQILSKKIAAPVMAE